MPLRTLCSSPNNTFLPSPNLSDARFSGDKHKVLGGQGGTTIERWKSLRAQGHGCNTADCDAHGHLHLWGRWDIFFPSGTAMSWHNATILSSYLRYEYICVDSLHNSAPEEINSVWLPAENPREACIRVFSWRLQLRGLRVCRAAGGGYGICKSSVTCTLFQICWKLSCSFCFLLKYTHTFIFVERIQTLLSFTSSLQFLIFQNKSK